MRLLALLSAINESCVLTERRSDRYMQYYAPLLKIIKEIEAYFENIKDDSVLEKYYYIVQTVKGIQTEITERLDRIMRTLSRNDRITWFILRHRVAMGQTIYDVIQNVPNNDFDSFRESLSTLMHKWQAPLPIDSHSIFETQTRLEHFMGIEYRPIREFLFEPFMKTDDIIAHLTFLEDEYKTKIGDSARALKPDSEATIIMEFDNGNSAWFNLNRPSCDKEAKAMGHCGNRYGSYNEIVLSFRTKTIKNGNEYWIPHLTFVLDKNTGHLIELKGFGNQIPSKKYHPYIVALLKQPFVKGIGPLKTPAEILYNSRNPSKSLGDFSLSQLPLDTAKALLAVKPALADMETIYRIEGASPRLIDEIVTRYNVSRDQFINDNEDIVIKKFDTWNEFINKHNDRFVKAFTILLRYPFALIDNEDSISDVTGFAGFNHLYNVLGTSGFDRILYTLREQYQEIFQRLVEYIEKKIDTKISFDDVEYRIKKIQRRLHNNVFTEVREAFKVAYIDGYTASGASQKLKSDFTKWMRSLCANNEAKFQIDADNFESVFTSGPVTITVSTEDFVTDPRVRATYRQPLSKMDHDDIDINLDEIEFDENVAVATLIGKLTPILYDEQSKD